MVDKIRGPYFSICTFITNILFVTSWQISRLEQPYYKNQRCKNHNPNVIPAVLDFS